LDKHQTVYNTCGRNKHIWTNMRSNKHIPLSMVLGLSVNLRVYCSLEKSDFLWGLLLIQ
jgi:hypothetical protein